MMKIPELENLFTLEGHNSKLGPSKDSDEICPDEICEIPDLNPTIWETIVNEDNMLEKLYEENLEMEGKENCAIIMNASTYLKANVYPYLIPALERCCALAMSRDAVRKPKQIFNGVDSISEYLWNNNPRYPKRKENWTKAYFIYRHRKFTSQRKMYPLHWIMSKAEAALIIQSFWKGYKVRRIQDVKEMRAFWKKIRVRPWIQNISDDEQEAEGTSRVNFDRKVF